MDSELGRSGPPYTVNQKHAAFRVVAMQIGLTLALALAATLYGGAHAGYSCLVGGLIGIVGTYYSIARMFRPVAERSPEHMVRAFYIAEALKIVLSGALFVIAFVALEVDGLAVIGAYAATTLAFWLALAVPAEAAR